MPLDLSDILVEGAINSAIIRHYQAVWQHVGTPVTAFKESGRHFAISQYLLYAVTMKLPLATINLHVGCLEGSDPSEFALGQFLSQLFDNVTGQHDALEAKIAEQISQLPEGKSVLSAASRSVVVPFRSLESPPTFWSTMQLTAKTSRLPSGGQLLPAFHNLVGQFLNVVFDAE